MIDLAGLDAYGVLTEPATLKLERLLPGPIERVWAYLVDSGLRRQWLASGEMASSGQAGRGADYAVYETARPVVLETELLNQTDLRNQYELNTAIVKAFHRMFMSVARG